MKIVPAYGNKDNIRCLQSCVRSVVEYLLPSKKFTKNYIDSKTLFNNAPSWLPPATIWLNNIGLKAKLYSPFNYERLSLEGEVYLKEFKGEAVFNFEKVSGAYLQLDDMCKYCKEMITNRHWVNRTINENELKKFLMKEKTLAIGKTVYEWLRGDFSSTVTSHYVLILEYDPNDNMVVHDPGKPMHAYRIVKPIQNGTRIFGDILTIEG